MADDLLEYARIEAGRLEYRIGPVRLRETVDEVFGLVQAQLEDKGLSWSSHVPETEVMVRADPDRLRQVLLNLVSNAVKFTPPGGRVEIAASTSPGGSVRIEVRDTGIGIPTEKLGAIFEPFVQVHQRDSLKGERGTGLGLAISRQMVRSMEGELVVSSTMGEGSTFTVALPSAHAAPVSSDALR
jgi:signal transduction histidine kinase